MKASIVYMEKLDIKEEQTGKLNYHVNKCVIYFLFILLWPDLISALFTHGAKLLPRCRGPASE